jgi:hypothetical protein
MQLLPHLDEHILRRILGERLAEHAPRQGMDAIGVTIVQPPNRRDGAAGCRGDVSRVRIRRRAG